MSLNSLHNSNFGAFLGGGGGAWLGLHGPSGHYMGPHGCPSTRIVTKSSPIPSKGQQKGFGKSRILEILQVPLNSLIKRENS